MVLYGIGKQVLFCRFSGGCRRGRDLKLILSCVDLCYNRNLAMPFSTMQAMAHLVLTSGNFQWRSRSLSLT